MAKILKKYFIPNEDNEYSPHIMRKGSVAVIAGLSLFIFSLGLINVTLIKNTSLLSAVISRTLVELANANRSTSNVSNLSVNPLLERAAQLKANDMASKGYFAHTSPDGKTPWHWFSVAGYDFQAAGENLAINFTDSADVDKAWMNSPGHRANILSGKFSEIGIATAKGYYNGQETVFVVQMFGKPSSRPSSVFASESVNPASLSTPSLPSSLTPIPSPDPQSVLGQSETFVEVSMSDGDVEIVSGGSQSAASLEGVSALDDIVSNPKKTIGLLYAVLGAFVIFSILIMIFVEIKKQNPKLIALGFLLLALIIALAYIFREMLFESVIVL